MGRYYPICLALESRHCVVVGGGKVALRKARSLLEARAAVTVVSPSLCEELRGLGGLRRIERPFEERDVAGAFLVYAATDDPEVNRQVAEAARKHGALVNVVDTPDKCDFIVPSTLARGNLMISISTCGASPALARRLRLELEEHFPGTWAEFVALLGEIRPDVMARVADPGLRRRVFERLADEATWRLFQAEGAAAVRQLAERLAAGNEGE